MLSRLCLNKGGETTLLALLTQTVGNEPKTPFTKLFVITHDLLPYLAF
jgi:hypothetical protein